MKKKRQVFHSMIEFEKVFLPKSLKKRMTEKLTDAQALGVSLAKESLEKAKKELVRS